MMGFELTALESADSEKNTQTHTTILIQTQSLHWTSSFNPCFSKSSFQIFTMADSLPNLVFYQFHLRSFESTKGNDLHIKNLLFLVGRANYKYMLWAEYSTNIAGQKVNGKADRRICTIFWSVHEQGRRRPSRALETTSWISRFFSFC